MLPLPYLLNRIGQRVLPTQARSVTAPLPIALLISLLAVMLTACGPSSEPESVEPPPAPETREPSLALNPLLDEGVGPDRIPAFHQIQREHFLPALDQVIEDSNGAIEEWLEQEQVDGTAEAIEQASAPVSRLAALFYALRQLNNSPEWQEVAVDFSTRLQAHADAMRTHSGLAERVEREYRGLADTPDEPDSYPRLVRETWRNLQRAGAELNDADQQRLGEVNRELTELAAGFEDNLVRETQRFEHHVTDPELLRDLPENLVGQLQRNARDRGHLEGWSFTLHSHSLFPVLRHSPDRELRKTLYQAWQRRAGGLRYGQSRDNGEIMRRMLNLRAERAQLLGHEHHLALELADSTLGDGERLEAILDTMETAVRPAADRELDQIMAVMREDDIADDPQPWDWWYYQQQLMEREHDGLDDQAREYFSLASVRDGVFGLANRLWGLSFQPRTDLPRWHSAVEAFEVIDDRGDSLGIVYLDLVHRPGKFGGAWTSAVRQGIRQENRRELPVAVNVANFAPAVAGQPVLLSPDEVQTVFHEFGHALHVIFSDTRYRSLAGTNVPPDFVEFPALLLERWALEPEVLRLFAFHHQTGSLIGDGLSHALKDRRAFLAGLEALQQLASIRIDMAWHRVGVDDEIDPGALEGEVIDEMDLPGLLSPRHRFNGYERVFAARSSSQDYRLLWSDVLAADAFERFRSGGLLSRELAALLRDEVLSRGNGRDPMESFEAFRGREPEVGAWLEERGFR